MPEREVYLDHAATSPLRPEAAEAVIAAMQRVGNPSSLHGAGRQARKSVEESREAVARCLGATASEVVFTCGGTEADNLAVKGLFWARRAADPRRVRIIASAVEHPAVVETVRWLQEAQGARVDWLGVDRAGRVDAGQLDALVAEDPGSVALITVMWANNEVGTVQPVQEIVAVAREHAIPVHADAVQAVGQLPVDFAASGLDALTVSGHKVGGPVGVGALLLRREVTLTPVLHGGGQERDVRSGTLDPPAYAGLAAALRSATHDLDGSAARLARLRDHLVAEVVQAVPGTVRNGSPEESLPGAAHFSFSGCDGDSLLLLLDAVGVYASTGSACSVGVPRPSHVLLAMGVEPRLARGSLRFTLGWTSDQADVDHLTAVLPTVVERARAAGVSG